MQTRVLKEASDLDSMGGTAEQVPRKTINDGTAETESEEASAPESEDKTAKSDSQKSSMSGSQDSDEAAAQESNEAAAQESTESEPEEPAYDAANTILISCRGESWAADGADKAYGWPAKLQALLSGNEINAKVYDYTLDMASSLSQMRFAGISEELVNEYVSAHMAKGLNSNEYEVNIRSDMDLLNTDREDYDAIPIICIGYNGGYGVSKSELIEQELLILNTYHLNNSDASTDSAASETAEGASPDSAASETAEGASPDSAETSMTYNDGTVGVAGKYLILGHLARGYSDAKGLDTAMVEAWGDHYLSINGIEGDFFTEAYRDQIAHLIYDKLAAMNYLVQE